MAGGYANGGDNTADDVAVNSKTRLGGAPTGPLTPVEGGIIGVICVLFVVGIVAIFYVRALQVRRNLDMENKEREKNGSLPRYRAGETEQGVVQLGSVSGAGSSLRSGSHLAAPSIKSEDHLVPYHKDNSHGDTADLESGNVAKRHLWHYVRWKDPYASTRPRVKPSKLRPGTSVSKLPRALLAP